MVLPQRARAYRSQAPTRVASARMATMVATASSASDPSAATVTRWPLVAPRPMTPSTLLASALVAPTVSETAEANVAAATASAPAGRACRSPVRVIACSQLAGMARLLGRGENRRDVPARGSGHRGGDHALDERRVGELNRGRQIAGLGEQCPDGEHGTAQVGDDHDACSAVGELDR